MMKKLEMQKWFQKAKPFLGVVFLQFGFAGMDVLSKAALNHGMSNYVLVVYRHAVATAVIAPFAVILDTSVHNLSLFSYHPHYTYTFIPEIDLYLSPYYLITNKDFFVVIPNFDVGQESKAQDDTSNFPKDSSPELTRVIFWTSMKFYFTFLLLLIFLILI